MLQFDVNQWRGNSRPCPAVDRPMPRTKPMNFPWTSRCKVRSTCRQSRFAQWVADGLRNNASLPRSSFPGPIRRPRLGGLLSARTELFFLTVMVVNPMRFTVSTFDARSGERLKKETITKCARLERRLGEIEREMNRIVDSIVVAGMPPERDHPRIGRVHHRACQPKPAWRCGNQSECRGQSECTDRHKGPSCRALRQSRPFPEHGYVGENVGSGRGTRTPDPRIMIPVL